MGVSIIDRLFAQFEAVSGKFIRAVGGRRANGTAQAFLTDYRGTSFVEGSEPAIDAFNRYRSSMPFGLWDAKQVLDNSPAFYGSLLTGAGTATFLTNEAATRMRVTTASGDRVVRQSLQYIPYQPGRSQQILMSAVMGAIKANVRQRIGYFDANNGVFFEQDGTNLKVVRRTFVSGAAVDNAVNQSAWNIDRLDGSGPPNNPSGITIDMTKAQLFVIDFEWLGAGRVRMGFVIDGKIVYCHQFLTANVLSTVWATSPMLPVRWEIENTAASASQTDMFQICAGVFAEGGNDPIGLVASAYNALSPAFAGRSVTNLIPTPIISVRLKTAYNRAVLIPQSFEAYVTTLESFLLDVYVGGTLSGGAPTVTSVSDAVEMVTGNNTLTGGLRVATAIGSNQLRIGRDVIRSARHVGSDITGTPELLTIVVTPITGNSVYHGSLTWREVY